jgi:hypothetical protein
VSSIESDWTPAAREGAFKNCGLRSADALVRAPFLDGQAYPGSQRFAAFDFQSEITTGFFPEVRYIAGNHTP